MSDTHFSGPLVISEGGIKVGSSETAVTAISGATIVSGTLTYTVPGIATINTNGVVCSFQVIPTNDATSPVFVHASKASANVVSFKCLNATYGQAVSAATINFIVVGIPS